MNRIKKTVCIFVFLLTAIAVMSENRFPKPDFESGYQYPQIVHAIPGEALMAIADLVMLVLLMSVAAFAVLRLRTRLPVIVVSIVSVAYFGFFRKGCVCSIGSVQNVAVALTDSSYTLPVSVLLFFTLPIVFTLLFGRVFCSGVCPFGAVQELLNVRNYRIPTVLAKVLGILPWIYLVFALLFAVTRSAFIICRFDPFIGIFRFGGTVPMIIAGAVLLILSIFTGRPFCRFLCPYGAILSLFSRVSVRNVKIVKKPCINCDLCRRACHVDAIRPPFDNRVKEERSAGVRRILAYFVALPLMALVGAFTLRAVSDSLAGVHKQVKLYELIAENEKNPADKPPIEAETFFGQGGKIDDLSAQAEAIKLEFESYSTVAGAILGLIMGIALINLSLKRTRKNYEIDDANCVSCGRCFAYCPQNRLERNV